MFFLHKGEVAYLSFGLVCGSHFKLHLYLSEAHRLYDLLHGLYYVYL